MAKTIFANKFIAIPSMNFSRGYGATIAGILGDSSGAEGYNALAISCAHGWQGQNNQLFYMKLTDDLLPAAIAALKESADFWATRPNIVAEFESVAGEVSDAILSGKDKEATVKILATKEQVLSEFLDLYFKEVKEGNPEVTTLRNYVAKIAGLQESNKQYVLFPEFVVACANRRIICLPLINTLNKSIYPVNHENRQMLQITSAEEINGMAAFTAINFKENHKTEVGKKRLRLSGSEALNSFVNHFINGARHADFGKATAANPYRLNLISERTGENDTSAMIRAYMFAKCAVSFPELNLLADFSVPDLNGNTRKLPGNKDVTSLQNAVTAKLKNAGYCQQFGTSWSTQSYGAITQNLPEFLEAHPDVKDEVYSLVKNTYRLALTAEEQAKLDAKAAEQEEKKELEKNRPDLDKISELTGKGVSGWIQTLCTFCASGKNAVEAQRILGICRQHCDELTAMFDQFEAEAKALADNQ